MKTNLGYYVKKINDIVKETEVIGETMNDYYEQVRQAIDEKKTEEITAEQLTMIQSVFEKGTQEYTEKLNAITQLRPPARVMGIHKKFERSYTEYVEGCKEMVASIDPEKGIDCSLFDSSEKKQDKATDDISFSITRMSNLLLKK